LDLIRQRIAEDFAKNRSGRINIGINLAKDGKIGAFYYGFVEKVK